MSSEASDFFLIIGVETVDWGLISCVYSIMDFCWLWLDVNLVNLHFSITERRGEYHWYCIVHLVQLSIQKHFEKYLTQHSYNIVMCGSSSNTSVLSIFLYYYLITDLRQFDEIGIIRGLETSQNSKFSRRKYSIFM